MQTVVIQTKTEDDSQLLLGLARKMGLASKILSLEEMEDFGLARAIDEGRKTKYVPRSKVMKLFTRNEN